jgi:hypothetical protein
MVKKRVKQLGGMSVADLKKEFKGLEGAIKYKGSGVQLIKELRREMQAELLKVRRR